MSRRPHVAVLGGGIMGSATARHLSERGATVELFDRAPAPFEGASRWNEGKIHLGYLYAADPSLDTARAVMGPGLDFADQVTRLTGSWPAAAVTPRDDRFLVHRESVVSADAMAAYFERVTELVRSHPGAERYLADASAATMRRLPGEELARVADPELVVAGFEVPERSVDTNAVADLFVDALAADHAATVHLGHTVLGVDRPDDPAGGGWHVRTEADRHGPFDAVVNALWEGRPAVDRTVGHEPDVAPQHRFRVSLFVTTTDPVDAPSAVVAVGPYGDVKNYDNRTFYLSWYPAGLLARVEAPDPPPAPELGTDDESDVARQVFDGLRPLLPWVSRIEAAADTVRVRGGWVYSQGQGRLDDRDATVHRRDRLGFSSVGTYHSVDTGKYSVAPTLAEQVAEQIVAETG